MTSTGILQNCWKGIPKRLCIKGPIMEICIASEHLASNTYTTVQYAK